MPFLSQKQKLCHQNSHSSSDCLFVDRATRRSLGFLAESHDFFVLLKRNGPSLRTLAEPEAEVKVVKLCFNKKKVLSKQIPLLQVSLFSSILIQTTGEHRYSWAAAQGGETQGSSHKSGWWQAEIPGPRSSSSCQPRGWWNETPGSSSDTCNPGT